ncbi:unnamed protein product, partial [marine sediment metagenome]
MEKKIRFRNYKTICEIIQKTGSLLMDDIKGTIEKPLYEADSGILHINIGDH